LWQYHVSSFVLMDSSWETPQTTDASIADIINAWRRIRETHEWSATQPTDWRLLCGTSRGPSYRWRTAATSGARRLVVAVGEDSGIAELQAAGLRPIPAGLLNNGRLEIRFGDPGLAIAAVALAAERLPDTD
jgi:hypothetical protein